MKKLKTSNQNIWSTCLVALALTGLFSLQAQAKMNSSLEFSTNPDGSLKISDVYLDDEGNVIGVPQTSLTDTSGAITGETVSAAAPPQNNPPQLVSFDVTCAADGTGTIHGIATDPDSIMWIEYYHAGGGWPISCPDCSVSIAHGSITAGHPITFGHSGSVGTNITWWFRATDYLSAFKDFYGGCFVSP